MAPAPPPDAAPRADAEPLTGAEFLVWRQQQLALGGLAADFDWLIDLGGGLPWAALQAVRLNPKEAIRLQQRRGELANLWRRHLTTAEPLQYLVGRCPWRDLELHVAPGVLIPRQETELLVDLALAKAGGRAPRVWADLGTGSGCLAKALALAWPGSEGLAVELSPLALQVASVNLEASGVTLRQGSWWEPLRPWWAELELVVANPPYIPSPVWAALEPGVREHEPAPALDGGADGLAAFRVIASGASDALAPGGWLLLEHHHDQSTAVRALLAASGLEQITAHPDLEGTLRFVAARCPEGGVSGQAGFSQGVP